VAGSACQLLIGQSGWWCLLSSPFPIVLIPCHTHSPSYLFPVVLVHCCTHSPSYCFPFVLVPHCTGSPLYLFHIIPIPLLLIVPVVPCPHSPRPHPCHTCSPCPHHPCCTHSPHHHHPPPCPIVAGPVLIVTPLVTSCAPAFYPMSSGLQGWCWVTLHHWVCWVVPCHWYAWMGWCNLQVC